MRRFECPTCATEVHFKNTNCLNCSANLAYVASRDQMVVVSLAGSETIEGVDGYTPCVNRSLIDCNWLSEPGTSSGLCQSCSHTITIPDISDPRNLARWGRLERIKRRLFYALIKSNLPLEKEGADQEGALRFELLADAILPNGAKKRVMTGHDNGLITINIAEADDAIRERNRTAMGEPYRTLTGHFRHETGHFYWDKLVDRPGVIEPFRALFGDERRDYAQALETYYAEGPPSNWSDSYVSTYATAHPWEDFAETWAHYFHMVGGLETAYAYGLSPQPLEVGAPRVGQLTDPYHVRDYEQLWSHWIPITVAMNAMNRSIGHNDYYPFALTQHVSQKLSFVHALIKAS